MLAMQSKSATAAGTFIHKSASGNVLETDVWVASELVSFESYGAALGALMRAGRTFGHVDLLTARDAETRIWQLILDWLDAHH
jgi:hypothetical protein